MNNPLLYQILCGVFAIVIIILIIIVRGFFKYHKEQINISDYKRKSLTGVEIEEIRRNLITWGMSSLNASDVLNLIYVIRDITLGVYSDEDPYIPADPYDDLE